MIRITTVVAIAMATVKTATTMRMMMMCER